MHITAKRILVVDDDPDILDALQLTLEDAGYAVTTSEKGEYAENLLDTTNGALPDLIPHLIYGLVTVATYESLIGEEEED